uniref:SLC12 domain-containing protein n=1 Tax=Elaeophora elaphi TaxID=1147741 RepID=A0A0R3S4F9_9BILA
MHFLFFSVYSNNDIENGKCEKKFKCERKFTFSSLESEAKNAINNRRALTNQCNHLEGYLPEERVIREVHSAVRLNGKIFEKSSTSALVILNLPEPPRKESALPNYMEYLNVLTHNLRRVLLVRGSGSEVITKFKKKPFLKLENFVCFPNLKLKKDKNFACIIDLWLSQKIDEQTSLRND